MAGDLQGSGRRRHAEAGERWDSGKNIPYHPPHTLIAGLDVSEGMLEYAYRRTMAQVSSVALIQADAQCLLLPDEAFDHVVATFAFCSIQDPIQGLREARRVLREGHVNLRCRTLGRSRHFKTARARSCFSGLSFSLHPPSGMLCVTTDAAPEHVDHPVRACLHGIAPGHGGIRAAPQIP